MDGDGGGGNGGRGGDDDEAEALAALVPAAFAETVKRREPQELAAHTFEMLRGEAVVVRANGFVYRGVLVGADEQELYLRGELRWVVLPLSAVTEVLRDGRSERPLGLPPGVRFDEKSPDEEGT